MDRDTIARLEEKFSEFPRARAEGVPLEEIEQVSVSLGFPFPSDYKEFLMRYGGAEVGPFPIFGLRKAAAMGNGCSVIENTKEFRKTQVPGSADWLIVSEDLAGNVFGLARDGSVYTFDHDFRATMKVAESFEDFLRKECLGVDEKKIR